VSVGPAVHVDLKEERAEPPRTAAGIDRRALPYDPRRRSQQHLVEPVMNPLHWPALVTLAALTLCFVTVAIVGRARGKYSIAAPATTGHEMFERAFRVQMNTLENTVIFVPALWLCAIFFGPLTATAFGALWLVGRIWYAAAYLREPTSRGSGFVLAYAAWGGLMVSASWGVLRGLSLG